VRYVMLPDAGLDYSAVREAQLLRSGRSGLVAVQRTAHWTFYELPHATPIVTAPPGRRALLTSMGQQQMTIYVSGPGRYLVRVRYSPYRHPYPSDACLLPGPDGMTEVVARVGGFLQLNIDTDPASVAVNAAETS